MEEAMVGSLLSATFEVIQNLLSVSVEFIKDLEKLEKSFLMVKDFLYDARTQQGTKEAVKRWLKELEASALDAENVLDELNYEVLRKKIETENKMTKKVQTFFSHSNPVAFRIKMGRKIRDINEKLKLINQEATGFGLQRHVGVSNPGVGSEARETDSFAVDPIFLERENDVSGIVEVLTSSPTEHVFSVLPIVGMGGLGKTTVARQVYGNEKIKSHFEKHIWVYVSKNFDAVILFKKILESLAVENFHLENREGLLKKLKENLGAKRYLLVLDDFWDDETEKWDDFTSSLSGLSSVKGNGIIVTTRSEKVASIVKTLPVHKLGSLSETSCWSIIKAKAFGEGDLQSAYETAGKSIAKRCQGLPLAAKVVGGLLRDKSIDEWLSNFGEDENNVAKILKLSFDHLSPPSVKMCFAYCSVFPKGFRIKREELIELWMAEGFLQIDQRNDMEVVGDNFFNLLLQNSLLQVVARDVFGNTTYCNMHDLVHDLATSVLGCKRVYVNNNLDDRYQVGDSFTELCHLTQKEARCLSTVFTTDNISDNTFSRLKRLHVLVLMGQDIKELPTKIRKLIHLRYLDISHTRIEGVPDTIGKLYHLQTLRAENCLRKLPSTLKYMTSLRHLHIPNIELPLEIGRLTSPQTLPYFQVGDEKGSRIEELGSLKNLKGELEISNLEKVDGIEEAKSARLFQKPNICKLKFVWNPSRQGEIDYEYVLEGLQPHPNLRSLEICRFEGKSFPAWTLKMAVRDDLGGVWIGLNNLMEIRLTDCKKCEEIPMLGHLPHLKSLYLNALNNVKSINSLFYGIENVTFKNKTVVFSALERLELLEMPNLTEWVEIEFPTASQNQQLHQVVVFPSLEYLKIENCIRLRSAPSNFPCLKELEILGMESSSPLASICGAKLSLLTYLKIKRLEGLVFLPDNLFDNNQNLSELIIEDCPNLTCLVPRLRGGWTSLRKLSIYNCGNLRELPNDLQSLNSLEKLSISYCPNLDTISKCAIPRVSEIGPTKQFNEFVRGDWLSAENDSPHSLGNF